MINLESFFKIEEDKSKTVNSEKPYFATVIETNENGVKLKLDGEDQPRDVFYMSLAQVSQNDRVYIVHVSGTILVIGKITKQT